VLSRWCAARTRFDGLGADESADWLNSPIQSDPSDD
jgi:hypothetical protein